MKAWVQRSSGVDGLVLEHVPDAPTPGHGQVRIRLRAAALNPRDLQVLSGQYGPMTKEALIPGSDAAGEVIDVGPDVWRVAPGDPVALTFHPHQLGSRAEATPSTLGRGGDVDGVWREACTVDQHELVRLPPHLSFDEGATLPCAALTAWSALADGARLMPGHRVLVQGTGGVSLFALQFAKLFGAEVIALAATPDKAERLQALGADRVIDRSGRPEWHEAVREASDGHGVERVIDVGGAATVSRSVQSLCHGGVLAAVGLLGGPPTLDLGFFMRGVQVLPVHVGTREAFVQMNRAIAAHRVRPIIAACHDFADVPQALAALAAQRHVGKLVIRIE